MAIEQNALRVTEFLRALNEKIITDPEFSRLYGGIGNMDVTIAQLATALATNYQRLEEARQSLILYPNRRQYQDDVDGYLQGLAGTASQIEKVWRQFRANTLSRTEFLVQQVYEETTKQLDQQVTASGGETSSTEATIVDQTQIASPSAQSSWLKAALNGLTEFKDFLSVAVDINKAIDQWSPALMESAKNAFTLLGQLHF